jgi:hypothetical protein
VCTGRSALCALAGILARAATTGGKPSGGKPAVFNRRWFGGEESPAGTFLVQAGELPLRLSGKARFHPICPTEGVGQAVESRRLAEEIVVEISPRLSARETTPSLWARSAPTSATCPSWHCCSGTYPVPVFAATPPTAAIARADAPPDGRAPDSGAGRSRSPTIPRR